MDTTLQVYKASCMPIFFENHVIMNWGPKNREKTAIFEPKFFYFACNKKKKTLNVESCNLDTTWVGIKTVCVPSLRVPSYVTEISEAENGQKVVNFEVAYFGKQ